jgi:hypothetical protein
MWKKTTEVADVPAANNDMSASFDPVNLQLNKLGDAFHVRSRDSAVRGRVSLAGRGVVMRSAIKGKCDARKLDVVVIKKLLVELPTLPHLLRRSEPLAIQLFGGMVADAMDGHEALEGLVAFVCVEFLCEVRSGSERGKGRRKKEEKGRKRTRFPNQAVLEELVDLESDLLTDLRSAESQLRPGKQQKERKTHFEELFPSLCTACELVWASNDRREGSRVRDSLGRRSCARESVNRSVRRKIEEKEGTHNRIPPAATPAKASKRQ